MDGPWGNHRTDGEKILGVLRGSLGYRADLARDGPVRDGDRRKIDGTSELEQKDFLHRREWVGIEK